jgi:hypothetical protein
MAQEPDPRFAEVGLGNPDPAANGKEPQAILVGAFAIEEELGS